MLNIFCKLKCWKIRWWWSFRSDKTCTNSQYRSICSMSCYHSWTNWKTYFAIDPVFYFIIQIPVKEIQKKRKKKINIFVIHCNVFDRIIAAIFVCYTGVLPANWLNNRIFKWPWNTIRKWQAKSTQTGPNYLKFFILISSLGFKSFVFVVCQCVCVTIPTKYIWNYLWMILFDGRACVHLNAHRCSVQTVKFPYSNQFPLWTLAISFNTKFIC